MENNIFEVTYDEYKGFVDQLIKDKIVSSIANDENYTSVSIYSIKTHNRLAAIYTPMENNEDTKVHYFVYNMPEDDERKSARPVQQIKLENTDEIKAFMALLNEINRKKAEKQNEVPSDDGNI